MKIEELQKYIQNLSPELYSFAYILIPDDLQASQLMIDGVQSFLIQKKALVTKLTQAKSKISKIYLDEIKYHLLKIIFELSKKRYQQLKLSFVNVEQNGGFYSLDLEEKAILYLKDKAGFELVQIEYISECSQVEVMSHLYSARIKMTELEPFHQYYNDVENGGIA